MTETTGARETGVPPGAPRPAPGRARPYHFPAFTHLVLPNGVDVILAPVERLPLVSVRLLLDCGAAGEAVNQAGVATLTANALAEGTERHDGAALAGLFEGLGGSLEVGVSWDGTTISTSVLRGRVEAAVELLAEVMRQPAFPPREVERLRAERLAELLEIRSEPRALADESFAGFLYRAGSRFALPDGGSRKTVEALGREDLLRHHRERFAPTGLTIVIAGDFELSPVTAMLERVVGDWVGTPASPEYPANAAAREERAVYFVRRAAAAQTELRVGHVGIPRSHPDYFAVVVMNSILGGVFNSRLNLNLRERHGYTYGASSSFYWRREAGPFVVSAAVATDVSAAAVREILHEIERMQQSPPAEKELTLVQSYLEGVFPIRFETTEAIAAAIASLKTFSLPEDYYTTYRERIHDVTAEDVLRVARAHLHPARLQVVAVGDAESIGGSLEALDLGPVTYADAETEPYALGEH